MKADPDAMERLRRVFGISGTPYKSQNRDIWNVHWRRRACPRSAQGV